MLPGGRTVEHMDFKVMATKITRTFNKAGNFTGQSSERKALNYMEYAELRDKLPQNYFEIFIEKL